MNKKLRNEFFVNFEVEQESDSKSYTLVLQSA